MPELESIKSPINSLSFIIRGPCVTGIVSNGTLGVTLLGVGIKSSLVTHHKIITTRCLVSAGTVEIVVFSIECAVVRIATTGAVARS